MKSLKQTRKGQIGSMAPAIISLVVAAVFLILGLVMTQAVIDTDVASTCPERNSSDPATSCPSYAAGNLTVNGLGTFANFWEIIVLAIVITVVIGLLLVVFGRNQAR